MFEYTTCGLDGVCLVNGYREYRYGDDVAVAIEDVDGLHRLIASEIISKRAPLTGPEFRFLRVEMDISQNNLAHLFGNSEQTIAKWEKGQIKRIPQWADAVIRDIAKERLLDENAKLSALLDALAEVDNAQNGVRSMRLQHNERWFVADAA